MENTTSFNFQAQPICYIVYSKDLPLQVSVTFHKSTGGVCSVHKGAEVFGKEGNVFHHYTCNMNRKTVFELFVVLGCWEKIIQVLFTSGVHIRQLPKVNPVLHAVHLNVMQ